MNAISERILTNFINDDDVLFCKQLMKTKNVFEIISCKENQISDILAWLLSPKEGHGLGDYFYKKMLVSLFDSVIDEKGNVLDKYEDIPFLAEWNILDITNCSFKNIFVEREVQIDDGRIDLLIVDYDNEVVTIIENKYGAKQTNNQLNRYKKWIKKIKKDFYIIKIYLDYEYENQNLNNGWLPLDYEWLTKSIKIKLNDELEENTKAILKQFYVLLEEEYLYRGVAKRLPRIAYRHKELLDIINSCNINNFGKIKNIFHRNILESKKEIGELNFSFLLFYWDNSFLIDDLLDQGKFSHVINILEELGNFEFETGKNHLASFKKDYEIFLEDEDGYWPIFLLFKFEDDVLKCSIKINITNSTKRFQSIITKNNIKMKSNQKRIEIYKEDLNSNLELMRNALINKLNKMDKLLIVNQSA